MREARCRRMSRAGMTWVRARQAFVLATLGASGAVGCTRPMYPADADATSSQSTDADSTSRQQLDAGSTSPTVVVTAHADQFFLNCNDAGEGILLSGSITVTNNSSG